MGHVEIVRLRARCARLLAQGVLRHLLAGGGQVEIVGDANDLHRVRQVRVRKRRHDLGVELYGSGLARHMRRVRVADQPLILRIDPRVQSAVEDQLHGLRGRRGVERVALDHREVGIDEDAAVKACDSAMQSERLDQHAHATWRPAARDGERNAGVKKLSGRCLMPPPSAPCPG